jgi:hypothetical protein
MEADDSRAGHAYPFGRGEDLDQGVISAEGPGRRWLRLSRGFRTLRERDRKVMTQSNRLQAALAGGLACTKTGSGEHNRSHRGQYAPQR